MEKITYSKALEIAIASVTSAEVKDKLVALKASVDKKNSAERKPTATQTANADLKDVILGFFSENPNGLFTVSELIKKVPALADLSNQKVSAIVRQMVADGQVVRYEDKRKAVFQLAK